MVPLLFVQNRTLSVRYGILVLISYPSTVFLTVPVDKVRFIFAADAASLVRPLNILFRDATDVEWMQ